MFNATIIVARQPSGYMVHGCLSFIIDSIILNILYVRHFTCYFLYLFHFIKNKYTIPYHIQVDIHVYYTRTISPTYANRRRRGRVVRAWDTLIVFEATACGRS